LGGRLGGQDARGSVGVFTRVAFPRICIPSSAVHDSGGVSRDNGGSGGDDDEDDDTSSVGVCDNAPPFIVSVSAGAYHSVALCRSGMVFR
jgi:hypothetical protein